MHPDVDAISRIRIEFEKKDMGHYYFDITRVNKQLRVGLIISTARIRKAIDIFLNLIDKIKRNIASFYLTDILMYCR